jgi:glycosyltransferase involved in cell wall biosynthesis
MGGGGQTPTAWQHSTYPDWARKHISVLPEGVDLALCKPDRETHKQPLRIGDWEIKPNEKLVTYVARDLEPYRGCHIVLRALPRLLAERKDVRVIMVGGDGTSYGAAPVGTTWKRFFLDQLGSRLDLSRVLFPGRIPYQDYVRMLQRSNAHVYFTYPFVASWSLREALACGAPVIGSDTTPVQEFVRHEQTGLLTPFFDPDTLTDSILRVLEDTALAKKLGAAARKWAEANLAMPAYLESYDRLIQSTIGATPSPPPRKPPAKAPFDGKPRTPTSVKPMIARKAKTNAPGRATKTAGTRSRP